MTGSTGADRVALVTGGARGIGLGISKCLADSGFDLVICGVRSKEDVAGTMKDLSQAGVQVQYCQADISLADDRQRLVDYVKANCGRLHVLINNAGVAPKVRADILEASEESFDRLVSINLRGPYFLTQLVANWMIEQKSLDKGFNGCVINVSSISAFVASTSRGDYCITKAGVSMATKLWATRLGEIGVPVYEIQPGIIKTDMTATVTEKYDAMIENGLLLEARWGTPDDVGKVAATLARGDMPYATGSVVRVDGGLHVQRL